MTQSEYTFTCPLNSSNLSHVYYDKMTRSLYLEFRSGGKAGYENVDIDTVYSLIDAESPGRYYNQHIRGVFKGKSVGDEFVERLVIADTPEVTFYQDGSVAARHLTLVPNTRTFKVRGWVLTEVEYEAESAEDAVALFEEDYNEVRVKEVVVSFE